ncbi:hypothetical protein C3737_19000 [Aeromonas jandaei]|nr:hypothetical protein RW26_12750 [Aeromonas sp. L_1B5_3]PPA28411.1 hypothetical protein C3737_19000 [Aeromonas jandaei]
MVAAAISALLWMEIPLLQFQRGEDTESGGRLPSAEHTKREERKMAERKMVPEKGPKGTLISKLTLCATDKKQIQEY